MNKPTSTIGVTMRSKSNTLSTYSRKPGENPGDARSASSCAKALVPAANAAALYRVVIVRMRWHPPTIAYVERRTAEGLTKKEIIRCLKRYVIRDVWNAIQADLNPTNAP